jgi:hypothetical protein
MAHSPLSPAKLIMPLKVNKKTKAKPIMGDKSPKSNQKKTSQKQVANKSAQNKKQQVAAAKVKPKK